MFLSEKRAPTHCLFPRFTPTPYYVLTVITPWPSLTLWACPTRLPPIPTQDRYFKPLGGSTYLCVTRQDYWCLITSQALTVMVITVTCQFWHWLHGTWCVSAGPAQGLHRHAKLQQPKNSYSLPIQRERRPKWHRGEASAATRQTWVSSLWRKDVLLI